ncbi:hypothetical protein GCM10008171_33100 [Methylopila jiangsuensis]|uniref:Phage tail protein n=1 Tax=Methylopila jiangsuensis TaxID=586230 RepID=A0A9W6N5A6_9HYPH|nr:hypothetical protein [Methylopila jiangsuensis]MDR6284556.1 hypothetical protein [Methylopila jiangsuensis]GLK78056.1 hypothetical protein GCM10008171_33100 [Methylopila jiangsuensis]
MPAAIGAAIFAIGGTAGATLGATTIAGATLSSIVGNVVLSGVLLGAQLLLAPKPDLPKQDGNLMLKQGIPPAIYGYGRCRITGAYMAYELKGSTSHDVIAIHQGRIDAFERFWLHEDPVSFRDGDDGWVKSYKGRYAGSGVVKIHWRLGDVPETPYADMVAAFGAADIWTESHRLDGIASAHLSCESPSAKVVAKRYPFGLPQLSAVGRWRRVWDPRDPAQIETDPATWRWSRNPAVMLLDYLTKHPAGFGLPTASVFAPTIAWWLAAMNRCDEDVARKDGTTEPRYAAGGWFDAETPREKVIGALLRAMDGMLIGVGDGSFFLYAGDYQTPALVLDDSHIVDMDIRRGRKADERINRLLPEIASPDHGYNKVQLDPVDGASVDEGAPIVSRPVAAEWVTSYAQGYRLADIEMDRATAKVRGRLLVNSYGENLSGRRYFMLNSMESVDTRGLPCEVVDFRDNSLKNGTYEVEFVSVSPDRYSRWVAAMEGRRPAITADTEDDDIPVPPLPTLSVVRETVGGVTVAKISATNPPVEGWPNLTLSGRFRKVGTSSWRTMTAPNDTELRTLSDAVEDAVYEVQTAYGEADDSDTGDWSPIETITVVSDNAAPLAPVSIAAVDLDDRASVTAAASESANNRTLRIWRAGLGGSFGAATDVSGPLAITAGATRTWIDTTVSPAATYRYWATSENASGVRSGPTGPAEVTIPA